MPRVEREVERRLPIGAEVFGERGVHFRVWAPEHRKVDVCLEPAGATEPLDLEADEGGYFSGFHPAARDGSLYRFRIDGGGRLYPDPASRFQPRGPHGPSRVVDPARYGWRDSSWRGVELEGQVIYEMHIGTFTAEGTWAGARRQLSALADLGITLLEVMPVAEFPGRFGWGYDGVNLFAPTRLYGEPDEFRRFVDAAHALGIGVILDVVYNHLGPDGNYLGAFSPDYFSDRYATDWGDAMNFDGKNSGPVREFFKSNAKYLIAEFHLDGLRLDATQDIHDSSPEHVLAAITHGARAAAGDRSILMVAENEPQDARLARPVERGGYGIDALWNDDFHHSAMVLLTGRNEAYYSDYRGRPQELISAAKRGYLFQGQWYSWQKKRRGRPAWDLRPASFVHYIQNHDQIANTASGKRAHQLTSLGRLKAMTALLLLGPATPMLFQGQEFAASSPFYYFADHRDELAEQVDQGRREFLAQFPSISSPEMLALVPSPRDPATFERCKLDLDERERHGHVYRLHRDLLRLRREDPVFREERPSSVDGAVLGEDAFLLRFFGRGGEDRLVIINLGPDLELSPAPEPLLAPPEDRAWALLWSSEDPRYGGDGTPPQSREGPEWRVPGKAALVYSACARVHVAGESGRMQPRIQGGR